MPIIYNGVTLTDIVYNGVALDKVIYNGAIVFEKITTPIFIDGISYTNSSDAGISYIKFGYEFKNGKIQRFIYDNWFGGGVTDYYGWLDLSTNGIKLESKWIGYDYGVYTYIEIDVLGNSFRFVVVKGGTIIYSSDFIIFDGSQTNKTINLFIPTSSNAYISFSIDHKQFKIDSPYWQY